MFFSTSIFAQNRVIIGTITDNNNKPLPNGNVIAKPKQPNENLKFAIANAKGEYKLGLETNVSYELRVAYLGYEDAVIIITPTDNITTHTFVLKQLDTKIDEIIIKYEYKPIEIKKDTVTFDVKAFANGNERKMKEVLEKMPGFEVSKTGQITFQGKPVNQFMVGNKPFFGGGSKLGVENIPADALDKIEMIDNFNEVGFMKQVSGSQDLALNVVLKKDKQNFVFGDIDAGKGNKKFYFLHAALFKYNPKTNLSFIGDINNTGKKTLSFEDMIRINGGYSNFSTERPELTNFYQFVLENTDVLENKNQFGALNFQRDLTKKTNIDAFALFAKNNTFAFSETFNRYLSNNTVSNENKTNSNTEKNYYGLVNVKLKYNAGKTSRWYYNTQFQLGKASYNNKILSERNNINSTFVNTNQSNNYNLKQYVEWHKQYNKKHTTTLVINQQASQETPFINWQITNPQLSGLIPIQTDVLYNIKQTKKVVNFNFDVLFKYYYSITNSHHLYFKVGNNLTTSKLTINELQELSNGTINNFSAGGFGNNINYVLNDIYAGTEYKFKKGNFTLRPAFYLHNYNLKTTQISNTYILNKSLLQPELNSEYAFSDSEKLTFKYKLTNKFPEAAKLSDRYTLNTYNTVYRGNALLQNENFHSANLFYMKNAMYNGTNFFASINFSKKTKTLRNVIDIVGINQFSTPLLTNNPETTWRMNGSYGKKIYKFKFKVNSGANWFNYTQTVNNITTINQRNSQNIGLGISTSNKKWPYLSLNYAKNFNQFKGITSSSFTQDVVTIDFDISFLKYFIFKTDFEATYNNNNSNIKSNFRTANASIRYQKKDKPFGFEISAQNYLNNEVIIENNFSDYIISNTTTYVLPRIFMFSISYKL